MSYRIYSKRLDLKVKVFSKYTNLLYKEKR